LGKTVAEEYALEVERLCKSVAIEDSLKEYSIDEKLWQEKLDTITQNALNDPCTGTNPRKPTLEDIKRIYTCCFTGERVDI